MQAVYQARHESLPSLLNPFNLVRGLLAHRELIGQLARREVAVRYKGAVLGIFWSFITPMAMLAIYTFVFGTIFDARWGEDARTGAFAMMLFSGIIPFSVFAETSNRSPTMILSTPSYVKKVVFPLEVLPVVALLSTLVHALISIAILVAMTLVLMHTVSPQIWLLPIAFLPLMLLCLGLSWFLASLGMFLRDIGHGISLVVVALNFLTPIFYPIDRITSPLLRRLYYLNPLTTIVESFRVALLNYGQMHWWAWGVTTIASAVFAMMGYAWFMKTKRGFADVI